MARPSWFLLTTQLRDRLVALNRTIRWQPPEIGAGRFGEWLEGNVDWAISRERYWGTPLNVWICEGCGAEHAPESLAEIARRAGQELPRDFDVHRPFIDDLSFPCDAAGCRGTLRRTPEVIDCWFDSGAMPFAQAGWPAALGPGQLPADFPADFISEGLDQTRGWFYTLHVLATFVTGLPEFAGSVAERAAAHGMPAADAARLGLPAYRACLVNNLLLDAQGKKMSKSRGNVVAPQALFDRLRRRRGALVLPGLGTGLDAQALRRRRGHRGRPPRLRHAAQLLRLPRAVRQPRGARAAPRGADARGDRGLAGHRPLARLAPRDADRRRRPGAAGPRAHRGHAPARSLHRRRAQQLVRAPQPRALLEVGRRHRPGRGLRDAGPRARAAVAAAGADRALPRRLVVARR
jgi:valyl-tRNA synthetase